MSKTQMQNTVTRRVNHYRNAPVSGDITLSINKSAVVRNCDQLRQKLSNELAERENLLADLLVKAGVISDCDAAAALAQSPDYGVINYVRIHCGKPVAACDAFVTLVEKVCSGRLHLNQAVVAANHVYIASATVTEAVQLVKWMGGDSRR